MKVAFTPDYRKQTHLTMVTPTGFEPMLPPWKGDVLTAWPRGLIKFYIFNFLFGFPKELFVMVAAVRFEPTTCRVWTGRYNQLSYAAILRFVPSGRRPPEIKQWLRRRDLNHATFGLWARRATKLLHSAPLNASLSYTIKKHLSTKFIKIFQKNIFFIFPYFSC